MLILGIESSCDETAAAVVADGREILSSVISSQIPLHTPFGGVVPELASREHLASISSIVQKAINDASVTLDQIDAIAVTQGPGLVGSLMIGVSFAKALSFGLGIPLIGVNHIEGHFFSVVFENPPIEYPAMALIVSGGHTNLFWVPEPGKYQVVSRTRDDAAGEAFDKIAKMLGLGYPGGPLIEKLALLGDRSGIKFTRPKISDGKPDFSFSGLKTAVAKYIRDNNIVPTADDKPSPQIANLAAAFQFSVIDSLVSTTERAAAEYRPKTLILSGGVACNVALQSAASKAAERLNLPVYFPSKHLSTDNAAMIAAAGYFHLARGESADLSMSADVTMRLQNFGVDDRMKAGRKVRYRV
ncbi:MAG: tRNA (adenosine(37)-N6)-threonylcarbamoyltransferase complex transferase subunit TsaD [Acidobacteriota bacterium]